MALRQLRTYLALATIGIVTPWIIVAVVRDFQEATIPMYVHPVVFLVMLLGDAFAIAGLAMALFAIAFTRLIDRVPRKTREEKKIKIFRPGELE